MTLIKRIGHKVTLGCDPAGGSSYAVLGAIVDGLEGPGAVTDKADTTILSDDFKTFSGAQTDPGTLTFKIAYDPSDSDTYAVLTALLRSRAVAGWQVTHPAVGSGTSVTEPGFSGWVAGLTRSVVNKNLTIANVTVQVSGDPGYGTTAAA